MLVPYLNNPSEEAIFLSNKIKQEHETMTLQNEEAMLKNTYIHDYNNKLTRPVYYVRNFHRKNYLRYISLFALKRFRPKPIYKKC